MRVSGDVWIRDEPLQEQFPCIFSYLLNKTIIVSEVGNVVNGGWIWLLAFRRRFFALEEAEHHLFA